MTHATHQDGAAGHGHATRSRYEQYVNRHLGEMLGALGLDRRYMRGEGCELTDDRGRVCLDFLAGFGSVPFGHNHPRIVQAMRDYLASGEPAMTQLSDLVAAGELAERLAAMTPEGLDRVCFANSGTETVEAVIKTCRAATGRRRVLTSHGGFHGKTLGSLSASGRPYFQTPFGAPVAGFDHVPFGDAEALEEALGEAPTAAVLLEPVQGEGGVVVPPAGYLQRARELCDQHGAALVFDEVQTGLGRCGTLFACDADGVVPDALLLAKALGGGMAPIGAVVMSEALACEDFESRHSSTFAGNAMACRVGIAVCDLLEEQGEALLNNVNGRSKQLREGLERLRASYGNVIKSVRGRGLLLGLEFDVSRDIFPTSAGALIGLLGEQDNLIPLIASHLLENGIRTAPTLNTGRVMRVEPPLVIDEDQCRRFLEAADRTCELVSRGDTGALAGHLVGNRGIAPAGRSRVYRRPEAVTPRPEDGRFAFIVHPVDANSFVDLDPSLAHADRDRLEQLGNRLGDQLEPFVIGQTRVRSATGATACGEFICVALTAQRMIELTPEQAEGLVADAVDYARQRGARIVGLGGFSSVVMRGGVRATGKGVAITTGNSYTVVSAVEAIEQACRTLGVDLAQARLGVLGAAGSIGGAATTILAPRVGSLTMIGNPANPDKTKRRFIRVLGGALREAAESGVGALAEAVRAMSGHPDRDEGWREWAEQVLDGERDLPVAWSLDRAESAPECDIILTATSSTEPLVRPEMLKRGAVVCDLSRPANTSRSVAEKRPDVLVIDGGVVEVPGRPHLGFDFGFPCGLAYACMAETMMLGLEQAYRDHSIGARLDFAKLSGFRALAERHGFHLAGLRSFDRPLGNIDWRRVQRARASQHGEAPARRDDQAPGIVAREAVEQVLDHDHANAIERMVDRHAEQRPDAVALIEGERLLNYAELLDQIGRAARALAAEGINTGDTLACLTHDSLDAAVVALAAMRQGVTVAYLNPFTRASGMPHLLRQSRPRMVLVGEDQIETAAPVLKDEELRWKPLAEVLEQAPVGDVPPAADIEAGTPAICLFSSGSTGLPKAVLHSHRDIINTNLNYAATTLGIAPGDKLFSPSRMFFAYGFNSVHQALFAGATALLSPPWPRPEVLFEMIAQHRPSVMFGVPTVFLLLLSNTDPRDPPDLSCLRLCVSAGEPLPEDVFDAWRERFGQEIVDGIGTTEVMSTFITNTPGEIRLGASGRVVPGFEVRLVTDEGRPAEIDEVGVLWVRGNTVTKGYWRDEERTADAFDEGWYCTNDMFYRDSRGWFYYIGRTNDMLKVGGCWVSPAEIEQTLRGHPAVSDAAVIADQGVGKLVRPRAFVVLRDGHEPRPAMADELKRYARGKLLPPQYPHFVEFVPDLPRTDSGKIQRHRLRFLTQSAA